MNTVIDSSQDLGTKHPIACGPSLDVSDIVFLPGVYPEIRD